MLLFQVPVMPGLVDDVGDGAGQSNDRLDAPGLAIGLAYRQCISSGLQYAYINP